MPKQVFVIDQFHGGQDSGTDPRDITMESSVKQQNIESIQNLETDKRGKIRISGKLDVVNNAFNIVDITGIDMSDWSLQGLMIYGSDYSLCAADGTIDIDSSIVYTKPTLIARAVGSEIIVTDTNSEGTISEVGLDFATQDANITLIDPVFFVAEGGIYACDTMWDYTTEPVLLKIVKRTLLQNSTNEFVMSEWYADKARLSPPASFNLHHSSVNSNPNDGYMLSVVVVSGNSSITGMAVEALGGTWNIGYSLEADYHEESDITIGGTVSISGAVADYIKVHVRYSASEAQNWTVEGNSTNYINQHPRLTGTRVYIQREGTEEWYLLVYINFVKATWYMPGFRPYTYDLVENGSGQGKFYCKYPGEDGTVFPYLTTIPLETYSYYSGRSAEDTMPMSYKTAVVMGKRTWIGHIKKDGMVYGDRMMKSPIRQYSTFPENNWIDVATDDGDDIVKLETFADRILQFKRSKLYIINVPVTGAGEFLEAEYAGYGVDYPCATTSTPHGIAFVNTNGVFLYDSEKVQNLLLKGEVFRIDRGEWGTFVIGHDGTDNYNRPLRIGYEPQEECIHIQNDIKEGYKISLINKNLSSTHEIGGNNLAFMSNFYTHNGFMYTTWIYNDENSLLFYNKGPGTATGSAMELITRDIDFNTPSIEKKIYKIWFTFKLNASAVSSIRIYYRQNGGDWVSNIDSDDHGPGISHTGTDPGYQPKFKGTSGVWTQTWIKPVSLTSPLYSIQLKLDSGVLKPPDSFELDDISIVYRSKRPK